MTSISPQFIGQTLLERGFRDFFIYLFKIIEQRPFILEPLHERLFDYFQAIYDGKITRCNINICPRSAKTTMSQYFLVYTLTKNPKSQIIYTSFSQSLLGEISSKIASIMENPIYTAMFPKIVNSFETEESNPIDDFWKEYLFEETGKNSYNSKIIRTYAGGICLFTSIGGAITGYGCSVRGDKRFTGYLCIDDGNKPADIRSETMREKVIRYFEETLLSRLNNPNTPIINIQQRLHLEDLSGVLEQKYKFKTLKVPLLNEDNSCNLPSQYNEERIKELKINNYMFQAQFQQTPFILGGEVIKGDWFRFYPQNQEFNYKKIIIVADTAMKVKEHNDYSVFMVGGQTTDDKLHILDVVRGKWEAPELKTTAKTLWNKWQKGISGKYCSGLYIEDKASGTGLIQELRKECSIPIKPIQADKDKLTRLESVLSHIECGNVLLPCSKEYSFNPDLISEAEAFSRDDSHRHDDQIDCLVYLIMNTIQKLKVSIYDAI